MRIQLPLYSYQIRSRPASPARLVNCFPEKLPEGAATPVVITRAPGIKAWITVGSGTIQGFYTSAIEFATGRQKYLYVVSGSKWYYVTDAGVATLIGDIGTPNRISMASNDDSIVLVNEPRAYTWDGATFSELVDADFTSRGSAQVVYLDKFYIHREPNSNRFFLADIGSATAFDPLQFANVDDQTDELNGILADKGLLICFGTRSTEFWENTGAAGVPFERIINGTVEVGLLDSVSIARVFNQVFWVADDYTVRKLEGLAPMRVSTHAIEQKLAAETLIDSFSHSQEGHFFYGLTTDSGTYLYDVVTQEWSERESYGYSNWLPRNHIQFAGKQLAGDSISNKVGELDFGTFKEWDNTQRMEWTYQTIWAEGQRAFHDRLEIVFEAGVGATTGQGSDPKIMLQASDDGGLTWQSFPDKTIGALGEYEDRAVWYNLGSARKRVYRAAVSDPVRMTVTDTIAVVRGGRL